MWMKDKPLELYVTVIQIYPQSVDINIICLGQEHHINDTEKFSQDWFCIELLLENSEIILQKSQVLRKNGWHRIICLMIRKVRLLFQD